MGPTMGVNDPANPTAQGEGPFPPSTVLNIERLSNDDEAPSKAVTGHEKRHRVTREK